MKFCAVAAVLLVSLFATSMALPARLGYYQQPSFYYQSRASPQRLMYLQYVQQPSSSKTSSRLTNAAAAFVAGETVATGTYLKDDVSAEEQQIVEESILDNTGANGAQSVAEAYPEEEVQDDASADEVAESEVSQPQEAQEDNQVLEDEIVPVAENQPETGREYNDEVPAEADPEPSVVLDEEPSAAEPVPEEAANDDDADLDDDEEDDAPVVPVGRRQVGNKASPAPLPVGTFFPVDFGGNTGGTIAIANSFSTGVSGSAKSQAIAYGKPETVRSKAAPVRRH